MNPRLGNKGEKALLYSSKEYFKSRGQELSSGLRTSTSMYSIAVRTCRGVRSVTTHKLPASRKPEIPTSGGDNLKG